MISVVELVDSRGFSVDWGLRPHMNEATDATGRARSIEGCPVLRVAGAEEEAFPLRLPELLVD